MKHNWTYKKLGEVVTIERGGSPRPIQDYITAAENGLNWIKIGDAVEGSKYITSTKEKIKPEGLKKTRFVHKGDFILSNSMSFGRPYILAIDGCIHDGWLVLHDENQVFDKSYLYYYLSSPSIYEEFKRLAVGGVVNNLNSDIVRKVKVAIPSLSEQESIVAELDAINHLNDLQEEQLREYDRLAQSLFYTTFGDPVSNPKGWVVKKLGEVCDVRDGTHDSPQYLQHSDYLLITSKNIVDGRIDFSTATNYISKEDYEAINKRSKVDVGDIIMPMIGTIGHPIIVREAEQRYCIKNVALIKFCGNSDVVNAYVKMLIDSPSYMQYMLGLNKGGTQKFIALGTIRQLSLPLPPLSLQQTFAAQIEAIEQQKALVRRSLEDTRTLLAARMQYYFE